MLAVALIALPRSTSAAAEPGGGIDVLQAPVIVALTAWEGTVAVLHALIRLGLGAVGLA
jgi:hypothetical protein